MNRFFFHPILKLIIIGISSIVFSANQCVISPPRPPTSLKFESNITAANKLISAVEGTYIIGAGDEIVVTATAINAPSKVNFEWPKEIAFVNKIESSEVSDNASTVKLTTEVNPFDDCHDRAFSVKASAMNNNGDSGSTELKFALRPKWCRVTGDKTPALGTLTKIAYLPSEKLLFVGTSAGVWIYNPSSFEWDQSAEEIRIGPHYVNVIEADPAGRIWLAMGRGTDRQPWQYQGRSLWRRNIDGFYQDLTLASINSNVLSLGFSTDRTYIGTYAGGRILNENDEKVADVLTGTAVNSTIGSIFANDEEQWYGEEGSRYLGVESNPKGVYVLDGTKQISHFTPSLWGGQGIVDRLVYNSFLRRIARSKTNTIWMASGTRYSSLLYSYPHSGGVIRYLREASQPWTLYDFNNLFSPQIVANNDMNDLFVEEKSGEIWAASSGGLFRCTNCDGDAKWSRIASREIGIVASGDVEAEFYDFAFDGASFLWVASSQGLLRHWLAP